MLNVHHLELFYYVARHGGISPAVRAMPYGIQQPAVSGQILKLEESIGARLFHRRPFALTPAGERLFAFISPFFGNLADVSGELRGQAAQRLRLAASAAVLGDHVPGLLRELRESAPRLSLTLREANQTAAESLLLRGEIDLAVTEVDAAPAGGLQSLVLARLPLVLWVREDSPHRQARSLLAASAEGRENGPLIALPPHETLTRRFQDGLRRLGAAWEAALEVPSLELVETYAAEGFGTGLGLAVPGRAARPGLRALPLGAGFPPVVVAALWAGRLAPLPATFMELVKARAVLLRQGGG